jgi:hypothetical protein
MGTHQLTTIVAGDQGWCSQALMLTAIATAMA